jgi:YD repeat-containing protein
VVTTGYDITGRAITLSSNVHGQLVTNTHYTALDALDAQWFINGVLHDYDHSNVNGRLSAQALYLPNGGGTPYYESYGYDNAGNLQGVADHALGQTREYRYDHRDRLTQAWTTGSAVGAYNQSYSYDALGNLLNKAGAAMSYGSNGNGTGAGPHQARVVSGQAYQYDNNGNLLSGGWRTYTWDNANKPRTVSTTSGVNETYTYDSDRNRTVTLRNGATIVRMDKL